MRRLFINKLFLLFSTLFIQILFFNPVNAGPSNSSNETSAVTINFSGMTPHLGETLQIRAIDKFDSKEVGRTKIDAIATADFQASVDGIQTGHSYWIDFFVDHNKNGKYDPPPTDHAWRLELNNATGSDVINFAHNTSFTDIKWPYMLTVHFMDMTPHVGQLLELRVIDNADAVEVGRTRVNPIPSSDFSINLPVLEYNDDSYTMDFYADFNKNGLFDAPPTDHAWEIKFNNNFHDTTITFTHNTNFTNFDWNYLLTFNLKSMTPHLGETVSLRLVKDSDNSELSRVIIPSLPQADVSVDLPGLEPNQDYHVDFYADHNKNGKYDAPPTDHAWRVPFNSGNTGNDTLEFTHNTNFTDINWSDSATDVSGEGKAIPGSYILGQNYPNPFNPSTVINYAIPQNSFVTVKIYDVIGREITTLVNEEKAPGNYEVKFDGKNLSSGIYFYQMKADNIVLTKKMILMK